MTNVYGENFTDTIENFKRDGIFEPLKKCYKLGGKNSKIEVDIEKFLEILSERNYIIGRVGR